MLRHYPRHDTSEFYALYVDTETTLPLDWHSCHADRQRGVLLAPPYFSSSLLLWGQEALARDIQDIPINLNPLNHIIALTGEDARVSPWEFPLRCCGYWRGVFRSFWELNSVLCSSSLVISVTQAQFLTSLMSLANNPYQVSLSFRTSFSWKWWNNKS